MIKAFQFKIPFIKISEDSLPIMLKFYKANWFLLLKQSMQFFLVWFTVHINLGQSGSPGLSIGTQRSGLLNDLPSLT